MTDVAPRLRHYPEWLFLKAALPILRSGDMATATRRTRALARLAKWFMKKDWAWANANMRLVYGPKPTDQQIAKLASLAFENIFLSFMEGMRVKEVVIRDVGMEPARQAWELGRGMILWSIHLGSWEPMLRRLQELGYPAVVVYRHANNPLSEKLFMNMREEYGVQWIRRQDVRGVVEALRKRKALCLMSDINTLRGGLMAPFLGAPAMCPPGPAKLAMQFQVPIVTGVNIREGDGRTALHLIDVLSPPEMGGDEKVLVDLTSKINNMFTPWIHQYAEQYNWLHGRWKTRADGRNRAPHQLTTELWPNRTEPFAEFSQRVKELLDEESR